MKKNAFLCCCWKLSLCIVFFSFVFSYSLLCTLRTSHEVPGITLFNTTAVCCIYVPGTYNGGISASASLKTGVKSKKGTAVAMRTKRRTCLNLGSVMGATTRKPTYYEYLWYTFGQCLNGRWRTANRPRFRFGALLTKAVPHKTCPCYLGCMWYRRV